ncbi:MAG: DUF2851 family protein [Tannerella sp.]|jgi:hypothetical protein|nr:DUF2851 family protein [Tannerella sp.]
MESMLQYVWKHRLYAEAGFITTDGQPVFVIDAGTPNTDAGPDFFNAKIRMGDSVWVGNVEIHERASDWQAHGHHRDKAYDSVILHVVRNDDTPVYRTTGERVLQAVLHIPGKVEENIAWLLSRDTPVPCAGQIRRVPPIYLSDWMTALASERLQRKATDIFARLEQHAKDWNEIFYITLMRNFGFGTNGDAFEWLAGSLPYKYILKHRSNPLQVEALLFGQAGLLDVESSGNTKPAICTGAADDAGNYRSSLCREYDFLRKKYHLKPVDGFLFKKLRTRPVNFPHVRIAQAAAVWISHDLLFSSILETEDLNGIRSFFDVLPSEYWQTHYHFRNASAAKRKSIGKNAVDVILVNTVVPVLFAYGKQKNRPVYCDRALKFLEELPPERNAVITFFEKAGVPVRSAYDTQALIQLRREYCDRKKCLYCRIGFRMIDN